MASDYFIIIIIIFFFFFFFFFFFCFVAYFFIVHLKYLYIKKKTVSFSLNRLSNTLSVNGILYYSFISCIMASDLGLHCYLRAL